MSISDAIHQAVEDLHDAEPVEETAQPEVEVEASSSVETATNPEPVVEASEEVKPEASVEAAPAPVDGSVVPPKPAEDPFSKEHGIAPQMSGGRENRIPYSRVKSIVEKAQKKAVEAKDVELTTVKQTVQRHEATLKNVAEFEKLMGSKHIDFLKQLAIKVPGYAEILAPVLNPQQQKPDGEPAAVDDGMPLPDQALPDGSKVYSDKGLRQLLDWNAKQAVERATTQIAERYKPIETAWEAQQRMLELQPKVEAQITEARTWPQFTENEQDIVKALQEDQSLSLEGAYRKVVFPKLKVSRETMRAQLMDEINKTPASTGLPGRATKPNSVDGGPKSIHDIIAGVAQTLKR